MLHSGTCVHCGKTFSRNRPLRGVTCSAACRSAYHRSIERELKTCKGCGKTYRQPKGPQTSYCSIHCFNAQRQGTHKADMFRICQQCGGSFMRTPGAMKRRFCSVACFNQARAKPPKVKRGPRRGPEASNWQGGISRRIAAQHRKEACERCGSQRFLCVHHRDRNRRNNQPDNLETLCKRCHQIEHGLTKTAAGRFAWIS